MPLTVNVGMNRKASRDFQSAGVSINLAAELDMGLLADPPRLQHEIEKVYAQAEAALDRQVQAMTVTVTTPVRAELPAASQTNGSVEPPSSRKDGTSIRNVATFLRPTLPRAPPPPIRRVLRRTRTVTAASVAPSAPPPSRRCGPCAPSASARGSTSTARPTRSSGSTRPTCSTSARRRS